LPEELYDLIWHEVEKKIVNVQYARVIMPLSALLEGEFFNAYIKRGESHLYVASNILNGDCHILVSVFLLV
jgi:hypothetical protein